MKNIKRYWILSILVFTSSCDEVKNKVTQSPKLKVLIIDGQNNHYVWPKTTMIMKDYLEQTDLFEVDIYRTDTIWLGIKYNKRSRQAFDFVSSLVNNYMSQVSN